MSTTPFSHQKHAEHDRDLEAVLELDEFTAVAPDGIDDQGPEAFLGNNDLAALPNSREALR